MSAALFHDFEDTIQTAPAAFDEYDSPTAAEAYRAEWIAARKEHARRPTPGQAFVEAYHRLDREAHAQRTERSTENDGCASPAAMQVFWSAVAVVVFIAAVKLAATALTAI